MEKQLNLLTEKEKEDFVQMIEQAIDCGNNITDDDAELYWTIIGERR